MAGNAGPSASDEPFKSVSVQSDRDREREREKWRANVKVSIQTLFVLLSSNFNGCLMVGMGALMR